MENPIQSQSQSHNYCYILYNNKNNMTYNGFTNNLERRLRQHNGEIKGGARCTTRQCAKNGVRWMYLATLTSADPLFDKKKALSCEWHIRYPNCRRPRPKQFNGPQGRLDGLKLAMAHPKFAGIHFDVCIHDPRFAFEMPQLLSTSTREPQE